MIVVRSVDNEKVKKYRKLQSKKYRDQYGQYIVEGMHLVIEAYKRGAIQELILEEHQPVVIPAPYTYFSKEVIKKISTMDSPCPIMALCNKREPKGIVGEKLLILDELQDPGNLGTIIRSAVAFNIDTIILSENTVDLYNPKVLRATQGMFFHTNIVTMNIQEVIMLLRNMKIPVYGTRVESGIEAKELKDEEKKRFALIVGNEGNGVREEINRLCDKNLYIPMNKNVESLNVAIATSVLLYELGR